MFWRRLLLAVLLCLTAGQLPAQTLAPTSASRVVTVQSAEQTLQLSNVLRGEPLLQPSLPDAVWKAVKLPEPKQPSPPDTKGFRYKTVWYRLTFELADMDPVSMPSVYLPAYSADTLDLYVNGSLLGTTRTPQGEGWRFPWLFQIPGVLLKPGSNELLVAMQTRAKANVKLAPVVIGPRVELLAMQNQRLWLSVTGPQVACVAIAIAGLLALGVWIKRRHETTYLFFALAALAWGMRTVHYFFDAPPIHPDWFWWMVFNALHWMIAWTYLFALRVHGLKHPRLERTLVGLAIAVTLLTAPPMPLDTALVQKLATYGQLIISIGVCLLLLVQAWRIRTIESWMFTVALWINLALGANDLQVKYSATYLDGSGLYLMPYGALLLFCVFLFASFRRLLASVAQVEDLNFSLEQRIVRKTGELEETYQRLSAAERQRATATERERLMRDMHDGIGSSLTVSLKMVEGGQLTREQTAAMLRDCLDDLRLALDSLDPVTGDLLTILAMVRYRLGKRLELAGVRLEWQIEDVPDLAWLDSSAALHVVRITQEILTNALKHADAKTIRVQTLQSDPDHVEVRIRDDGHGFEVAAALRGERPASEDTNSGGRGLNNLQRRAQALHGRLDVESDATGTRYRLILPVSLEAPSAVSLGM
jgi:signal transduction histidine kinase